jgi:Leucine-rich repeat (LRR) protein
MGSKANRSLWTENLNLSLLQILSTIPSELGLCTQLETLLLEDSGLTGSLPTELANLSELRSLIISRNLALHDTIPSEYEKLTKLETFDFSMTQITGINPVDFSE